MWPSTLPKRLFCSFIRLSLNRYLTTYVKTLMKLAFGQTRPVQTITRIGWKNWITAMTHHFNDKKIK